MSADIPSTETARPAARGRLLLVLLALLFLGPLGIAAFLYYGPQGWGPAGSTANGELLAPVVTLPPAALPTASGETTAPDFMRGKWSLVYVQPGDCEAGCQRNLIKIRQIRLAIGAEADRVQRVYLYGGRPPSAGWLDTGHEGLITGALGADPLFDAALPDTGERLYIADPLGNLVLAYPPDTGPGPIHDDLEHLMEISRIG